jgi:hypothetical protein
MQHPSQIYPKRNLSFKLDVTVTFVMEDEATALNHYDIGKLMLDVSEALEESLATTLESEAMALEDGARVNKVIAEVTIPNRKDA